MKKFIAVALLAVPLTFAQAPATSDAPTDKPAKTTKKHKKAKKADKAETAPTSTPTHK